MSHRVCPECDCHGEEEICPECGTRTLYADANAPQVDPRIGQVFDGRYRIDGVLGRGGMGKVYRATQISMNNTVAVKVVDADQRDPLQAAKRFHREAKASSMLTQPHSVRIFDFGQTENHELFMAMELLDGRSLGDLLDEQHRLPVGRAIKIASEISQSLIEAHALGLIHRDLKPENVILVAVPRDPDFVKVLDFGIAKFLSGSVGDTSLTRTGAVIGTPHYMAPEQTGALGELTTAVDIYALGVLLYEMLAGVLPFPGDNPVEVLMAHMHTQLPPLPPEVELPPALHDLLLRMLEKIPQGRPSAEQVFDELERLRVAEIMRVSDQPLSADTTAPRPAEIVAKPPPPPPRRQVDVEAPTLPGGPGPGVVPYTDVLGRDEFRDLSIDDSQSVFMNHQPVAEAPRRRKPVLAFVVLGLLIVMGLAAGLGGWLNSSPEPSDSTSVAARPGPHKPSAKARPPSASVVPGAEDAAKAGDDPTAEEAPQAPGEDAAVAAVAATVPSIESLDAPAEASATTAPRPPEDEPEVVASPPPEPARALVRFRSTPSGAVVYDGEEALGSTPFEQHYDGDAGKRHFSFKKEGFLDAQVDAEVLDGIVILATLTATPKPKAAPPKRRMKPVKKGAAAPATPKAKEPTPAKTYEPIW